MEARQLGATGVGVTSVSMGCWPITGITSVGVTREESLATLTAAFEAGIRSFDSAFVYGHEGESERMIAEALGDRRAEITIATKAGLHWENGKTVKDGRPETILAECAESLRRLNTDVIDLYYLHCPDPDVPIAESAGAFQHLKARGCIRAVGLSNVSIDQAEEFAEVCPIDAIQPHYNMLQREIEASLLPWCRTNKIAVLVYWPLLKGLLAGKLARNHNFGANDGRPKYPMFQGDEWEKNQDFVDELRTVAGDTGCTVAQLVIAWTIAQPGITSALCGARRPDQIRETAAAMRLSLSADTLNAIDSALVNRGQPTTRGAV